MLIKVTINNNDNVGGCWYSGTITDTQVHGGNIISETKKQLKTPQRIWNSSHH